MSAKVKLKLTPQVVVKAGQDAAERIGKRFGAFVYTTARGSIRKKKSPAAPGQPPRSVAGTLKKNILFAYDKDSRSVVIGPRLLPGKEDAPEALEKGLTTQRKVFVGGKRKRARVKIEARPFMAPALEKRLPELPLLWQNAIRK